MIPPVRGRRRALMRSARCFGCPLRRFCRRGFVVVFVFFFFGGVLLCVLRLWLRRLRPCVGICRVVLGVVLLCGSVLVRGVLALRVPCAGSARGGRRWFVRGVPLFVLARGGRGVPLRWRGFGGRWVFVVVVGGLPSRFLRFCRLRGGRARCLRSVVLLLFGADSGLFVVGGSFGLVFFLCGDDIRARGYRRVFVSSSVIVNLAKEIPTARKTKKPKSAPLRIRYAGHYTYR